MARTKKVTQKCEEAYVRQRFEDQVFVNAKTKCWEWRGIIRKDGYAAFWAGRKICGSILAHRYSFFVAGNQLLKELCLDHVCRVRHCVNPSHLRSVTQRENILAGLANAAVNARKICCQKCGNAYSFLMGSRRCADCARTYHRHYRRRWRAKQKAEKQGCAVLATQP